VAVTGKNNIPLCGSINVANCIAVGTAHAPLFFYRAPFILWHRLAFSQTYKASKFVLGSFRQNSILLTQGSIL